MRTIKDYIQFLLPRGSRGQVGCIDMVPLWPPDVFGIAAYLVEKGDCYRFILDQTAGTIGYQLREKRDERMVAGRLWKQFRNVDDSEIVEYQFIHNCWNELKVCTTTIADHNWILPALNLLIISDIACERIGLGIQDYPPNEIPWIPFTYSLINTLQDRSKICPDGGEWISRIGVEFDDFLFDNIQNGDLESGNQDRVGKSACILVDEEILCVHPKMNTPDVGCTLRSLSLNLSLHTGYNQVLNQWYNKRPELLEKEHSLNVLLVPFPYVIHGADFEWEKRGSYHGVFRLNQNWLNPNTDDISNIVIRLLKLAETKESKVDIITLPELALDLKTFHTLCDDIKHQFPTQDFVLISGILEQDEGDTVNRAMIATIYHGEVSRYSQSKHHRWRLDTNQINTYGLSSRLEHHLEWWEDTRIDARTIPYLVFRKDACLAALICEDLARSEPCLSSLKAVAPNIVFALLMDGPQLTGRWPERYAMGLSDDPGSSVLTFTSLGLVVRSNWFHRGTRQTIGLWRDQRKGTVEIDLPPNHHGLLLTLQRFEHKSRTIDGREGQQTCVWGLGAQIALKLDD